MYTYDDDSLNDYYLYFKEFNTVKICGEIEPKLYNSFFRKNFLVNKLEKIHLGYVDEELNIIESIKKCPKLKYLIIDNIFQIELFIDIKKFILFEIIIFNRYFF